MADAGDPENTNPFPAPGGSSLPPPPPPTPPPLPPTAPVPVTPAAPPPPSPPTAFPPTTALPPTTAFGAPPPPTMPTAPMPTMATPPMSAPPTGGGRGLKWWHIALPLVVVAGGVGAAIALTGDDDDGDTQVTIPEITVPDITIPDITFPDVTIPEITIPEITDPPITDPPVTDPPVTEPPPTVPGPTVPPGLDGVIFVGQPDWTMAIGSGWEEIAPGNDLVKGQWFTFPGTDSPANANVTFEDPAVDITLDEYVQLSTQNIGQFVENAVVEVNEIITRPDGTRAGRVVYTFTSSGIALKGEAVIVQTATGFAVATFVTVPEKYDAELPVVEPFLLTLSAS